ADQVQWPQVGLNENPDGTPDATSGWGTTVGTYRPIVAVIDTGVNLAYPDLVANLFINVNEVPRRVLVAVGDQNGDGVLDWHDLDADGDGVLTFPDLDATNAKTMNAACPHAAIPQPHPCNPLDLVHGRLGLSRQLDVCNNADPPDDTGYGWEDGIDADCNGFVDDIVGWNFDATVDG